MSTSRAPARDPVVAYNADVGWLRFVDGGPVDNVHHAVDEGFSAVKLNVGSDLLGRDVTRCQKVCEAAGDGVAVATAVNGKWNLPTALRFARENADLDLFWVEEPLWHDDVEAHAALARDGGLQIYTPQGMSQFIRRKAVHRAQPDVTRIGGRRHS